MKLYFAAGIACFVMAGCDDGQSRPPSDYIRAYGDPATGIVTADDKWTCPKGYALLFFQGSGFNPSCFAFVPANPRNN